MKSIEEIIKDIDGKIEKPIVDARFGDKWKVHTMNQYNNHEIEVESIITIAWKQGRRAILLERAFLKYASQRQSLPSVLPSEETVFCKDCEKSFIEDATVFNWDTGARRCFRCQVEYLESQLKQGYPKEFLFFIAKQINMGYMSFSAEREFIYNHKVYTLDELYQYWIDNVKDK